MFMLGTNDAKPYNWNEDRYRIELKRYIEEYTGLPQKPQLILMTPPSCFPEEKTGIVAFDILSENVEIAAQIVREEAENAGLKMIDMNDHTKTHPEWSVDGVHPNAEGNRQFAKIIAEELK